MGNSGRFTTLDVYREAFGLTPKQILASRRELTQNDLSRVISVLDERDDKETPKIRKGLTEVWPLVSHHTYNQRALFGTSSRNLRQRVLTLILIHDGIVVADPLVTIRGQLRLEPGSVLLKQFISTTEDLAQVEDLIESDILRLTALRPNLAAHERQTVLQAMGLGPDLRVFTDFLQAAETVPSFPGTFKREFAPQVRELYARFGIPIPFPKSLQEARDQIRALGAAIIEVSWQFAVAAQDPSCDLAIRGPIEAHLASELIRQGLNGNIAPARHLPTLDLGLVPNLNPKELKWSDAVSIRKSDAFTSFRQTVRGALDLLSQSEYSPMAKGIFEERMNDEAQRLQAALKQSRISSLVTGQFTPVSLAAVSTATAAVLVDPSTILEATIPATAGAAMSSFTNIILDVCRLRRNRRGMETSQRYFSMLGTSV